MRLGAERTPETETDPDLAAVQRVLAGDPSAFGEIVQRHEKVLRRVLLGIVADTDQADDVLQDSFLIAYRQLASFKGRSRFKTWLSRITVREGMRARSKLRRIWGMVTPTEDGGLEQADVDRPIGRALEDREEARALLAHLPMKERTAFVMFAEGWSHQEISDAMASPMGTVASWIHRAKGRLAKVLDDVPGEGAGDPDEGTEVVRREPEDSSTPLPFRALPTLSVNTLPAREGL